MQLVFNRDFSTLPLGQIAHSRMPLVVNTAQGNFLFNSTPGISKNRSSEINHVLVTHIDDETITGLIELSQSSQDTWFINKINIYSTKSLLDEIGKKVVLPRFNVVIIEEEKMFKLNETNIELIPFKISKDKLSYRFDHLIYSPSVELSTIPTNSEQYLYGAKAIIFDGDSKKAFMMSQKFKPMRCYFTRQDISHQEITYGKKKGFRGVEYTLIQGNSTYDIERTFTQRLSEERKSITLSSNKFKLITQGKVDTIIMGDYKGDFASSIIYLTDSKDCYGVIKFGVPYKINLDDFKQLTYKHHLSDKERRKWFGQKQVLFAYPFNVLEMYATPRRVKLDEKQNILEFLPLEESTTNNKIIIYEDKEELVDSMVEGKYIIEQDIEGLKCTILKSNGLVTIKEGDNNVSYSFPKLVESIKTLTGKDFVIHGVIKNEELSVLYLNEISSYGMKDLTNQPWYVRNAALKELNYNDVIKKVTTTVTNCLSELQTGLDMLTGLSGFNMVTVKPLASYLDDSLFYKVNLSCNLDDVEKRNTATTTDSPGISGVQGTAIGEPVEGPGIPENDQGDTENVIRKEGEKWCVFSKSGTKLTCHNTRDGALAKLKGTKSSKDKKELSESRIKNHGFFDSWSPSMAYYLGFLSSDGNLDNKTDRIEFGIHKQDGEILRELARQLGDKSGPKEISGSLTYRFKSKQMADRLRKLGMDIKKPNRKTHLKVPSSQIWNFIRGAFDADGTVGEDRIQFDSGNRGMVKWIATQFGKISPNIKHYSYDSIDKVVVLSPDASKVHAKIYSNGGPRLSRKANKKFK